MSRQAALRLLPLLDLTRLEPGDEAETVVRLARRAVTPRGQVAAVCVLPPYIGPVRDAMAGTGVRVATVANFPAGAASPEATSAEIADALAAGADEIDVVMPYAAFRDGDQDQAAALLDAARRAAGGAVMKVILETGALADPALIRAAGALAVECGADFLKTSTGKIAIGATLEHAVVLIEVIASSSRPCGLKLSGGVRTLAAASAFLALHDRAFGPGAAAPGRLRFGASSLLDELLAAAG